MDWLIVFDSVPCDVGLAVALLAAVRAGRIAFTLARRMLADIRRFAGSAVVWRLAFTLAMLSAPMFPKPTSFLGMQHRLDPKQRRVSMNGHGVRWRGARHGPVSAGVGVVASIPRPAKSAAYTTSP